MGYYPRRSVLFDHEAKENKHSRMLIYSQGPVNFGKLPDIFCPQPPIIAVSSKGEPDHFLYTPTDIMTNNGFENLHASGVKPDYDGEVFRNPGPCNDYRDMVDQINAGYSLMDLHTASSSFQNNPYHVSPFDSPNVSFSANTPLQPAYVQAAQPTCGQWQPEAPRYRQTSTFTGGLDYQTAPFEQNGLPGLPFQYTNTWQYANGGTAMPMNSSHHYGQTDFPDVNGNSGSFSSTYTGGSFSSAFSSSFGDNLSVHPGLPPRAYYNSTPVNEEMSNSPQSPENYFASSASSPANMTAVDSDAASSETLALVTSRWKRRTTSKSRKQLPDKQPRSRRPQSGVSPKPTTGRRKRDLAPTPSSSVTSRHTRTTRSHTQADVTRPYPESQLTQPKPRATRPHSLSPTLQAPLALPAPRGRLVLPAPPRSMPAQQATSAPESPPLRDDLSQKDQLLLRYKGKGMGYKEIKEALGCEEAVSTLRGRYRTITKPKEARVRRPAWTESDLRLLERGVRSLASDTSDLRIAKIPWMRVAAYIKDNGGSYHFGNSTCRKRWDELFASETMAGKNLGRPFYEQWFPRGGMQ